MPATAPSTRRTPSPCGVLAQVRDVGRLVEMKAVGEARRERLRRPPSAAQSGRAARPRRPANSFSGVHARPAIASQHQELVERRAADVRADLAVRMQEAAAVALPADVFGGELEGGAGAAQEIGSRRRRAARACRAATAASSGPRGASAAGPVSTTGTSSAAMAEGAAAARRPRARPPRRRRRSTTR